MVIDILKSIQTSYVDAQTLLCLLKDYKKPWDWISREVKKGSLIRLKNGLFVLADKLQQVPKPQLANILYGPSYVSLQWALSFYGLIPERSVAVTSVTTKRNKKFLTPIGPFTYSYLNQDRYCMSIDLANEHYLIATPEKALIDFIYFYCESYTAKELLDELTESYRFTLEDIVQLNQLLLKQIAQSYRAPIINLFIKSLGYL